jgi:hypothetical protein
MSVSSFFKKVADYLESTKTLLNRPFDSAISAVEGLSERYNSHSEETVKDKNKKFSFTYVFPPGYTDEQEFKEYHLLYQYCQTSFGSNGKPIPMKFAHENEKIIGYQFEFSSSDELANFQKNVFGVGNNNPFRKNEFIPQP